MFVITLIQRTAPLPQLDELLTTLNGMNPSVPFTKTYKDEIQGAFTQPAAVLDAISKAARYSGFWIGIGVGELKIPRLAGALGAVSVADCEGDALDYSRMASEKAQSGSPARAVVVQAANDYGADSLTGLLRLLYRVVAARTETENRVLDLMIPGVRGQQRAIGRALGITSQAVSKTLTRSYWHEEYAARAAMLALFEALEA